MNNYNVFLALIIAFLLGVQPVVHKHLLSKYNAITIMIVTVIVYFFLVAIVSIIQRKDIRRDMQRMPIHDLLILVALAVFTVFVVNMLYYYVLKDHSPPVVSSLIYAAPFFTLVFSYLFLKERLNMYGVAGIIVMVIGILLIMQNERLEKDYEYI
jgi:drug/metabolite transporter (DMT)-like permease